MNVLIACEESQRVCIAFRENGHNAFSCDLADCSGDHPEWHIKQDVLKIINPSFFDLTQQYGVYFRTCDGKVHFIPGKWDMIIAFPPCTYLTNSGNPYFNIEKYGKKAIQRYKLRDDAFAFFMSFANADCEKVVIENPIGFVNTHWRKPDQIIQPWQFGHPFTKSTCLWIKGVDKLFPVVTDKPLNCKSYAWETMYDDRGKSIPWNSELCKRLRSKTFPGVASAMASQWG